PAPANPQGPRGPAGGGTGRGRRGRTGRPHRDGAGIRPGPDRGAPAGRTGWGDPAAHPERPVRDLGGRAAERRHPRGGDGWMTEKLLARYPLLRLLSPP